MSTIERLRDRGERRAQAILVNVAHECRDARIGAGLSQRVVGRAAEMSTSQVSRAERGALPSLTVSQAVRLSAAVGLDLSVKCYPSAVRIRDAAHVALLQRLRQRLGRGLRWRTEVPLGILGDQRAWDAVIMKGPDLCPIEAEVALRDGQAALRRLHLKMDDVGATRVILLVRASRLNREALRTLNRLTNDDFPLSARAVLAALTAGELPTGSGIVVL
jgi:hypothetical protein